MDGLRVTKLTANFWLNFNLTVHIALKSITWHVWQLHVGVRGELWIQVEWIDFWNVFKNDQELHGSALNTFYMTMQKNRSHTTNAMPVYTKNGDYKVNRNYISVHTNRR